MPRDRLARTIRSCRRNPLDHATHSDGIGHGGFSKAARQGYSTDRPAGETQVIVELFCQATLVHSCAPNMTRSVGGCGCMPKLRPTIVTTVLQITQAFQLHQSSASRRAALSETRDVSDAIGLRRIARSCASARIESQDRLGRDHRCFGRYFISGMLKSASAQAEARPGILHSYLCMGVLASI
jgi:hypothetical protein